MKFRKLAVAVSLVLAASLASAASPAMAEESTTTEPTEAAVSAKGAGVFETGGDHVHYSATDYKGHKVLSAHGWWNKYSGSGSKAKVTVWIQYKKTKKSSWRTVEKKVGKVKPKNIYKQRVTAREVCSSRSPRYWRSVVDVDIIGVADTPEKLHTKTVKRRCAP